MLLFLWLLLNGYNNVWSQTMTVDEARKVYAESMKNKETCEIAYKRFSQVNDADKPLLVGYKGAVMVAMSKHLKTAKEKIAYFNEGKKLIEQSITEDNKNVELKFIRFTIQSNCPPALKYNKEMSTDKKYIIDNLNDVKNVTIRLKIKDYLLQSTNISQEEKQKLHDL